MSKLRENIDRILGNSIRCLLPSYWWKRLFGMVVDEVDKVKNEADKIKNSISTLEDGYKALEESKADADTFIMLETTELDRMEYGAVYLVRGQRDSLKVNFWEYKSPRPDVLNWTIWFSNKTSLEVTSNGVAFQWEGGTPTIDLSNLNPNGLYRLDCTLVTVGVSGTTTKYVKRVARIVEYGGDGNKYDTFVSETSTNAVQNKIIKGYVDKISYKVLDLTDINSYSTFRTALNSIGLMTDTGPAYAPPVYISKGPFSSSGWVTELNGSSSYIELKYETSDGTIYFVRSISGQNGTYVAFATQNAYVSLNTEDSIAKNQNKKVFSGTNVSADASTFKVSFSGKYYTPVYGNANFNYSTGSYDSYDIVVYRNNQYETWVLSSDGSSYLKEVNTTSVISDSELSDTSENAVQNKVVTEKFTELDATKLEGEKVGTTEPTEDFEINAEIEAKLAELSEEVSEVIDGALFGNKTANLFNKATTEDGYYVTPSGLTALANWSASEFIPIKPNTTYSATLISNSRYYGANKNDLGAIAGTPFTTPSNAAYIRLSMNTNKKDTFMLNEGDVLKEYEVYGLVLPTKYIDDEVVEFIGEKLGIENENVSYLDRLRVHLSNPFIKTQIKLVGDSITAGMGGTGFSANGEVIGGGSFGKTNIMTATCWSNMFYHYINDQYNKEVNITMNNPHIEKPFLYVSSRYNDTPIQPSGKSYTIRHYTLVEDNTVKGREFCKFTFYGNHFTICIQKSPQYAGLFEVMADGNIVATIDCYAEQETYFNKVTIQLSQAQHNITLRCLGSKNGLGTSNEIRINGLMIPKTAIVKTWGVSGTTSELLTNKEGYITEEDDFVIAQFGTNDRSVMFSPYLTQRNLVIGCNNIINDYKAQPILMCASPVSEYHNSEFAEGGYFFTMNEVHDAIASAAEEIGMPFIDNYTAMQNYADEHGLNTDDLLSDGLHPNDLGYKVMFINIMENLGLARRPYYNEWLGENTSNS